MYTRILNIPWFVYVAADDDGGGGVFVFLLAFHIALNETSSELV